MNEFRIDAILRGLDNFVTAGQFVFQEVLSKKKIQVLLVLGFSVRFGFRKHKILTP